MDDVIANGFRPVSDPWMVQRDRPWKHDKIVLFRHGWDEPKITRWADMHPMMNCEGLYWKPLSKPSKA